MRASPRGWQRLRAALGRAIARRRADGEARANRDRGTNCFYCGVAFGDASPLVRTIDHRLARSRGGTDALVNLVFACRACNERKADGDEATFVASDWLARRRVSLGTACHRSQGAPPGEGHCGER